MKKRNLDFRLVVESDMDDKDLHKLAIKTCKQLTLGCGGKFVIAVAVIDESDAKNLFNVASKLANKGN